VVLIVLSAEDGVTEQDSKIAGYAYEAGRGCIFVVNKWDTVQKDNSTMAKFTEEIRRNFKYLPFAPILFISASTGQRTGKIVAEVDLVMEQYQKRVTTGELNRIFTQAVDEMLKAWPASWTDQQRRVASALVPQHVQANEVPDPATTLAAQAAARSAVGPIQVQVLPGEIVVRDGSAVTEQDVEKLRALDLADPAVDLTRVLGHLGRQVTEHAQTTRVAAEPDDFFEPGERRRHDAGAVEQQRQL